MVARSLGPRASGSLEHLDQSQASEPKQKNFFCPNHLLVQKVETSKIVQNSGQVSLTPPSRITNPYKFGVVSASKQVRALYCECV